MKLHSHIQYLLLLHITLTAAAAAAESYYSINAPGIFKSNRKYLVAVALHEASGPCSIRVGVEGGNFKEFQDVNLKPYESKTIEFLPKKLIEGEYFLKAEGLSGLSFKNESRLHHVLDEGPNIYIQTDKGIYKPKDLVRFRVVILDEHTRPVIIQDPIRVEILDAEENRVKQFKNVSLTHGIFTGKFQLSKYPVLGVWKIRVCIDGTYNYSHFKTIKVYNYVLPKFSVYLKTPSSILLEDGYLKVVVYGKYTFDKYVEGNATIELWNEDNSLVLQTKNVELQNLGFVDFNIKDIADIGNNYGLKVKATLTENDTGKTASEETFLYLRKQRYNLEVPYTGIEFENNKPYSIKVQVKHWTGAPVLDRRTPVTMEHGNKTYESFLDGNGAATFEFEHDANDSHRFQFKDSMAVFPNIYTHGKLMLNNREYYCRLKLVDKSLKFGKPVLIEVSSIRSIPYLMYTIMGHASLIRQEYIKVPPEQKSFTIEITPSIEMIPQSFLYVYYIHKGNLQYEELTLSFPREFAHQISVAAPNQVKPAADATIVLNAQPMSTVGILAVDLGVYLLDHSYDLSKNEILTDLVNEKSYSPVTSAVYPGIVSGLVTLTNAHYPFKFLQPAAVPKSVTPTIYFYRKNFPETWIFDNYVINETETKLTLRVPDTITTWRITAFANNDAAGFGIVNKPTDITVTQSFFLSLNLPLSVKRGEIVTIPVTIFNYHDQNLDTQVVFYNNDKEFYFMETKIQGVEKSKIDEQQQIRNISAVSGKGTVLKFFIYPLKVGAISLRVTAANSQYSDAVLQQLEVEPEGVPKQQNQALYLSIPKGEKISTSFSVPELTDKVPESEYITFSVGGHYLVPTIANFNELTQVPSGTGEQNMINFAPSVLILQYLKVNGKLRKEKELVEGLLSHLEVGYQQQLSFRHDTGGYSVFGMETDEEPSTWLTAYVVRYFIKATQFLDIETRIIESDLDYLAGQQKSNGEFLYTGYLLNRNHKNAYGFTAFVLLAFLEDQQYAKKYQKTIESGVGFLNSNLNNVHDTNALSLVASVIKRAKNRNAQLLIKELQASVKEKNGLRWWSANDHNPANDIEMTANAALTLLDTAGDHTPILKWLIEQRNANGGFVTCYDTVVGMEALVKFSEKYKNLQLVNLKVSYSAKDGQGNVVATDEIHVDANNVLSLQKQELPKNTRRVTFEMEGNGVSLVQLNQQYNVQSVQETRYFNIKPKLILKNPKEFILNLCFTYLSDVDTVNDITNMVIVKINLPSGCSSEAENYSTLKQNDLIRKIESRKSKSILILHLDNLEANTEYCLDVPVDKVSEILMPKPSAVIMYDYHNFSRSNTEFYNV